MAIAFELLLDADDDWNYSEDITSRMFAFETHTGSELADTRIAPPNRAEIRCYNGDNYFTPGHPDQGAVTLGRFIQIKASSGVYDRELWTGTIHEIITQANPPEATILGFGRMKAIGGAIPFQTMRNVTADIIIQWVLDHADMPRKLVSSNGPYWIVNRGLLGTSTVLASRTAENVDLGTGNPGEGGLTEFELVGNQYTQPYAEVVLEDAVRADWGWLYEDNDSRIIFLNRHQVLGYTNPGLSTPQPPTNCDPAP